MKDGAYPLGDGGDLFYLCGVGQKDTAKTEEEWLQRHTNVHLAVRPKIGSVATIASKYGVVFTITDAEEIPIEALPEKFAELDEEHFRCKNFQFGYQVFETSVAHVSGVAKEAKLKADQREKYEGELITQRRVKYNPCEAV